MQEHWRKLPKKDKKKSGGLNLSTEKTDRQKTDSRAAPGTKKGGAGGEMGLGLTEAACLRTRQNVQKQNHNEPRRADKNAEATGKGSRYHRDE